MREKVENAYKYPYRIYKNFFPNGNLDEFNKSFVTFDVSKEEFLELTRGDKKYICLETVVFDTSFIKSSMNKKLKNKNQFRIC